MRLARPELLALAPLAATLLALALALQWRRLRKLERVYSATALRRLLPLAVRRFPRARLACLVLAGLGIALGVAGLGPDAEEPPPPPAPLDLAIAVDVSLSMSASDTEPNRMARARDVIQRVSEALPSARTVLVVFADWPYTLVPPTDDPAVVRYFARSLEADLVLDRDQGTSLSTALAHAREALAARPRPGAREVILVLSDGGAHESEAAVLSEAAAAAAEGVEIWTAGLGTARGAALGTETGPVLDAGGVPVVTGLDEELLRQVAAVGGGSYERVADDRGARVLVARLQEVGGTPAPESTEPEDVTFLLALLALPLLLLEGALDAGRGVSRSRPLEDA